MTNQPAVRRVSFRVEPWDDPGGREGGRELVPYVDDARLVDLVSTYEQAARFDVAGGYAGLVLDHFNYGDLNEYLTGAPRYAFGDTPGTIALLGCNCGDVGCWPLLAQVVLTNDLATWRNFTQPHRPNRDYTPFGPFTFRLPQYQQAVNTLTNHLA